MRAAANIIRANHQEKTMTQDEFKAEYERLIKLTETTTGEERNYAFRDLARLSEKHGTPIPRSQSSITKPQA